MGIRTSKADASLLAAYRSPRSAWAIAARRTLLGVGVLMVLGAAYESLYVIGVLSFSILSPMPLFTLQTLPPLAFITLLGGMWFLLKGLRGIGDTGLAPGAIVPPGRTVRRILRGVPGLLPLNRVTGVRVVARSTPSKLEVRYRADSGRERKLVVPLAAVADLDGFLSGVSDSGIEVGRD